MNDTPASRTTSVHQTSASRPISSFRASSLYISVFSGVQLVLGLGLQVVLGYVFGTSQQMDEYLVAVTIPQLVQIVVGPALTVSLAPCWARWKRKGVEREALGAGLITVLAFAAGIAALTMGLSGSLPALLAPGLARTGDAILAGHLMRALAMAIVPQTIVAYLTAAAIARRRHQLWPIAGVVGVAVQLALTWIGAPRYGISALAGAYLISAAVQFLLLGPYLPGRPERWRHGFRHLRPLLKTASPVTFKGAVTRFTTVSDRWIASWIGVGAISQVVYGTRLAQAFTTVLSSGVGTTVLPDLSRLACSEKARFEATVIEGVRVMAFMVLPVTATLFLWARPLVRLIYGRGAFTEPDVVATALVVLCASGWFTFSTIGVPIIMALYALEQHRAVSFISTITAVFNFGLAFVFAKIVGVWGIPLAFSVTALVNLAAFVELLRRLRGRVLFRPWRSLVDPNLVSLIAVTSVLLLVQPTGGRPLPATASEVVFTLGRLVPAAAVYLGVAAALKSSELSSVIAAFRGILNRVKTDAGSGSS